MKLFSNVLLAKTYCWIQITTTLSHQWRHKSKSLMFIILWWGWSKITQGIRLRWAWLKSLRIIWSFKGRRCMKGRVGLGLKEICKWLGPVHLSLETLSENWIKAKTLSMSLKKKGRVDQRRGKRSSISLRTIKSVSGNMRQLNFLCKTSIT